LEAVTEPAVKFARPVPEEVEQAIQQGLDRAIIEIMTARNPKRRHSVEREDGDRDTAATGGEFAGRLGTPSEDQDAVGDRL
jgi:hypothetical protein